MLQTMMTSSSPPVLALGLSLDFVRRGDVVRWADRRIVELDSAPEWLIDYPSRRAKTCYELIGDLKEIASGINPVDTCKAAVLTSSPFFQSYSLPKPRNWRILYTALRIEVWAAIGRIVCYGNLTRSPIRLPVTGGYTKLNERQAYLTSFSTSIRTKQVHHGL